MGRSKKASSDGEGAPMWIVTFSDLMSLLLTFFVLLLSFSTISERKFNEAAASLKGALGVLSRNTSIVAPHQQRMRRQAEAEEREKKMKAQMEAAREMQRQLQVKGQEKKVKIDFDALGGLKISLPNAALFDVGSDALKPEGFALLRDLGEVLSELPEAFIEVRGHTDTTPVTSNPRFRDNRDLSYFRAYSVADYLTSVSHLPPSQFEVHAMGEFQPLAGNDTEEGRSANRRVEIFVRGPVDQSKINPFIERIEQERGVTAPDSLPLTPRGPEATR